MNSILYCEQIFRQRCELQCIAFVVLSPQFLKLASKKHILGTFQL